MGRTEDYANRAEIVGDRFTSGPLTTARLPRCVSCRLVCASELVEADEAGLGNPFQALGVHPETERLLWIAGAPD